MVAVTLGFVVGFLALPGHCLLSDPVFRAPVDTVADCADWIVAQPADNCHLLAERGHVSVGELLSHNPALRRNCDAVEGLSYCKERKSTAGHELAARQSETITGSAPQAIQDLVNSLFIKQTGDKLLTTLWDARVIPVFNSLSYADFSDWLNRSPQGQEMRRNLAAASLIACGLPTLANLVRQWIGVGPDPLICICYDQDTCCGPSDSSCPSGTSKLLARSPKFSSRFEHDDEVASLERRADSYPWAATDPQGQTWSGSFTSVDWPTPRDFAATDWQWQHAMAMDFNDDCTAFYVVEYNQAGIQAGVAGRNVAGETIYNFLNTEHYIEKNLFAKFVKAAIEGNLAGGGTFTTIPGGFFQNFMNTNQAALANIATMPGAQAVTLPARRLMWTLGSGVWRDNFLLLQANLNLMKAAVSVSPKTPG
ncbi:hypothetical protein BR93DRAFT_932432 [Coniochaeta sp. PMI_546]|nr:hypothetical protein BR93DRAFT_932432 [Coniochaeta sp. PMI_546]